MGHLPPNLVEINQTLYICNNSPNLLNSTIKSQNHNLWKVETGSYTLKGC